MDPDNLQIPNENQLAFVDCETFGLDPDNHKAWEWGVIVDGVEHLWQVWWPPTERKSQPIALEISGYRERGIEEWNNADSEAGRLLTRSQSIKKLVSLVAGRHIVGAVPSFDEERLRREYVRIQRENRVHPDPYENKFPWHYHVIDVEAMIVGHLLGKGFDVPIPWKSDQLSELIDVEIIEEDRHTALGDARWARRVYARLANSHQPLLPFT